MAVSKLLVLASSAALLAACEARIGNDAPAVEANASAEGKAEEGRLTVSAPGFNMQVDIPVDMRDRVETDGDDDLLYPGSNVTGIHVQAGPETKGGDHDGEVELAFTSRDPADRILAWYRDPARAGDFTIQSARREGRGYVLAGTGTGDDERFTLRLAPAEGGGTQGRLFLSDRR